MSSVSAWLLLPACAPALWDRRVYGCDEVRKLDLDESSLTFTDEPLAPRDDCFVVVRNLDGLDDDGDGTLRGDGVEVFTNTSSLVLHLTDTDLDWAEGALGPRGVDGDIEELEWFPARQDLFVTADDEADELTIHGAYGLLDVSSGPDTEVTVDGRFDELWVDVGSLNATTQQRFDRVNAQADEVDLQVPYNATYDLRLQPAEVEVLDGDLLLLDAPGSSVIDTSAPERVSILGVGDPPEVVDPSEATYDCGYGALYLRVRLGDVDQVAVDIVDTQAATSGAVRWESHGLIQYLPNMASDLYEVVLGTGRPYDPGWTTRFRCADLAYTDDVTWLVRGYADGALHTCLALGDDPAGVLEGTYEPDATINYPDDVGFDDGCEVAGWTVGVAFP